MRPRRTRRRSRCRGRCARSALRCTVRAAWELRRRLTLPGCPLPRFRPPATDRASFGGGVLAAAEALAVPLMPWQELVALSALEHDDDGQLCYRDVGVST